MSNTYTIIFRGGVLPGHELADVKARMAQLFKLDGAKLAVVFSGKPVALKKGCDEAMAAKLKATLNKAGAEIEVRAEGAAAAKPVQQPTAPAAAPAPPPAQPATAAPSSPPPQTPVEATAQPAVTAGEISVAPMTGELVSEAERAALRPAEVEVSTDHIQMEKQKASFGVEEEPLPTAATEAIVVPEFDVAEVGADVLAEDERHPFVEKEIDLSGISLAEAGADVLAEDERPQVEVVEVEDLAVDLAPVGADIGEIKKDAPPPPPDTSHISIE